MDKKISEKRDIKDLQKLLKEKRESLRRLRFLLATGKEKKVSESKKIRKEIARILTNINQKNK